MTDLKQLMLRRVALEGPMTLSEYMQEALLHPKYGYYQQRTAFGRKGDFITSPDISQCFGEMCMLYLAERWQAMGAPNPVALVELGPGRGTLIADMLRTAKRIPGLSDALEVHLVEAGARRRTEQRRIVPDATWHADIASLPAIPTLMIANEFFDALPVHQFEFQRDTWMERGVGADPSTDTLCPILLPAGSALALRSSKLPAPRAGDVLEICPQAQQIAEEVAQHMISCDGAGIFFDYGYSNPAYGDSFQALAGHGYADPLNAPGEADLTCHVNFAALFDAAQKAGASVYGPREQGSFLLELGIGARLTQLCAGKSAKERATLESGVTRLTDPAQMGRLFKVFAIEGKELSRPPCF